MGGVWAMQESNLRPSVCKTVQAGLAMCQPFTLRPLPWGEKAVDAPLSYRPVTPSAAAFGGNIYAGLPKTEMPPEDRPPESRP